MKPCKSCPFRRDARHGLWEPAHYLLIAYLGSADGAGPIRTMACHQFNGKTKRSIDPKIPPPCVGWVRAARHTVAARIVVYVRKQIGEKEVYGEDCREIMSPEEMARVNGIDLDHPEIPPLQWKHESGESYFDWLSRHQTLREKLEKDAEYARKFVLPGSPLDNPPTLAEIDAIFGEGRHDYAALNFSPNPPEATRSHLSPPEAT